MIQSKENKHTPIESILSHYYDLLTITLAGADLSGLFLETSIVPAAPSLEQHIGFLVKLNTVAWPTVKQQMLPTLHNIRGRLDKKLFKGLKTLTFHTISIYSVIISIHKSDYFVF